MLIIIIFDLFVRINPYLDYLQIVSTNLTVHIYGHALWIHFLFYGRSSHSICRIKHENIFDCFFFTTNVNSICQDLL